MIFPPVCVLCGLPGHDYTDLCADCRLDLPYNRVACPRCAVPLDGHSAPVCGHCLRRPPPFDRARSLFRYASPVDHLILNLKFSGRLTFARILGELLADELATDSGLLPDAIVPVPLHRLRQRQRGFNQAAELARPVARRLGLPIETRLCRRVRATEAQMRLDADQRRGNVRGAFEVSGDVTGRRLALIDDVITTGSTVEELARALRRAGAASIEIWSIARAPG